MVTAITMTNVNEALGIARGREAAEHAGRRSRSRSRPTAGCRPAKASARRSERSTPRRGAAPAYYMINCAHPTHFAGVLARTRPGSSACAGCAPTPRKSHAELDEATELDEGDPVELGRRLSRLLRRFPHINVLGGCCGTDHRHIEQIGLACRKAA